MSSPTIPVPLGTKAQTLDRLRSLVTTAVVLDQMTVTLADWRRNRGNCLQLIRSRFPGRLVVVRSSAPTEDTAMESAAGVYDSVLGVDTDAADALAGALDTVVRSYESKPVSPGFDLGSFEILVQPMLPDVTLSGVALSRDLHKEGPYLVVNYDEGGRTDTVTAGTGDTQRVVRVHHRTPSSELKAPLDAVVATLRELITLTGREHLDMEFAISGGRLYVFQARPLVLPEKDRTDADTFVDTTIKQVKRVIEDRDRPRAGLYGSRTAYSDMTDWNPAEIIGTRPRPLAVSLYRRLVMKEIWREARGRLGYHDPSPHHLMVTLAGHPYVDIRNDFNSYLPADLGDALSHKLIDYYLDRLRQYPELHDKAEFDICVTSLDFDFPVHAERLVDAAFTTEEIAELRECLLRLTTRVVRGGDGQFQEMEQRIQRLAARRSWLLSQADVEDPLHLAEALLDDAACYGTLPFSVIVRGTFIATAFWRSLLNTETITRQQHDDFLAAVETVSTHFTADLERCRRGRLTREEFLDRYGHLRPGTYDITVPTYADEPDRYLATHTGDRTRTSARRAYSLPGAARGRIQQMLEEFGFDFGVDVLLEFVRETRVLRELYKFEFTKNLSRAMDLIVAFGSRHGLSRDELSFLSVEDVLALANREITAEDVARLRRLAAANRQSYELNGLVHLPDVITGERDVVVIENQVRIPNFVTSHRVTAPVAFVDCVAMRRSAPSLAGHIVLAENADPGYEWLFSHDIAGLVTRYGGAASHMTIRCAEFGIPAAVGCGETIFNTLAQAGTVTLDCGERRVFALD
ncbi:pyruvate, phosphate dikinase [Streptomyces albiflavescens]|uniref:Pyruvate, phosphate dikinase n=1 Tax=Streptomyces albiflavescens TaxID=1623582 RepID=A0A917Y7I9_9ACTN|nr:PEP-utilizing enzyme [Streptomyces albiflavescens]GGN72050.1 pyruvate, phosphate dikinase [Streptomyces albiflavescens]